MSDEPLLQQLIEIQSDLAAERDQISYHDDWESITRVRSSHQWIDDFVRRAQKVADTHTGDRADLARRLLELVDEVTGDGDYADPQMAVSRAKYVLEHELRSADPSRS